MHRVIAIIVLFLVIVSGLFIWKYEGRANKDALNFKAIASAQGSAVVLSWSNEGIKKDSVVEIYQSENEALDGEKIGEVSSNSPQIFTIENLLKNKLYFFTLKLRNGGDSEFLSRTSALTEKYSSNIVITAKNEQKVPVVKVFSPQGDILQEFAPFDLSYRGDIDVVRVDIEGDGAEEVVVFPRGPHHFVKIFSSNGNFISQIAPYGERFIRGFSVTALSLEKVSGAVNYLAVSSLWASDAGGNESHPIKIYRLNNSQNAFELKDEFIEYENFNGGVELFSADTNGDGKDELITTPIEGAAEVRVHQFCQNDLGDCLNFYGQDKFTKPYNIYDKIFPYGKTEFQNIDIYAYDLNGDGRQELVIYPKSGRMSLIKAYYCEINESYRCLYKELESFQAYHDKYKGGVNVVGYSSEKDRCLAVTPRIGGGPHLKLYCYMNGKINLSSEAYAYSKDFIGGVSMMPVHIDNFGTAIVTLPQNSAGSHVRVFDPENLGLIKDFFAFDKGLRESYRLR